MNDISVIDILPPTSILNVAQTLLSLLFGWIEKIHLSRPKGWWFAIGASIPTSREISNVQLYVLCVKLCKELKDSNIVD